jgi:hypothetical protein
MPPLAAICIAPRPTMRAVLDTAKKPAAIAIVVAAMLSFSLRDLDIQGFNEVALALGLSTVLLLAPLVLVVMSLVGIAFYFVVSAAAVVIGRWMLGGSGTYRDVRLAVAWGLAPQVWALFFRLPVLLLWPDAIALLRGGRGKIAVGDLEITPFFSPDVPLYQVIVIGCLELAFFVWYLTVGSGALGEAQGFSSLRGLANLLLAVVLPFVALAVVMIAGFLAVWTV